MHKPFYRLPRFFTCLLVLTYLFSACGGADAGAGEGGEEQRPNIIFILTDDQRWDALGYAGNEYVETPEMDKLARSGSFFNHAMVTTPICAASRASIFSSRYERTHRFDFQVSNIREEYMEDAYPIMLKNAGYRTGFYGKFGVQHAKKDQLFEEYEYYDRNNDYPDYRGYYYKQLNGDSVHLTRYTGQKALDFIKSDKGDRPFSLSLCFSAPHAHDSAPLQYFWQHEGPDKLTDATIPDPELGDDRYFDALPPAVRSGFNRFRWGWRYDTPEKYQHSVKGYYRMINGIDQEIAKIRAELEAKGIADNTVIILMGDNGHFLGERQLAGKWLMYDNSVRVPLLVYDPRVAKHQDFDQMVLNIDVPATMLDLAGIERPADWQGQSLVPLVQGTGNLEDRDTVLLEHLWDFDNIPPSEGVRTTDWKYFRYVNEAEYEELYNLKDDPQETVNLIDNPDFQEVRQQLTGALERRIEKYSDRYSAPPVSLATKATNKGLEFSWELADGLQGQTAYQIIAASSLEDLAKNKGDILNTGEEVSDDKMVSLNVKRSRSTQNGYWKIRVWDEEHRLGRYSAPQPINFTSK